jgi:hypothetical protein
MEMQNMEMQNMEMQNMEMQNMEMQNTEIQNMEMQNMKTKQKLNTCHPHISIESPVVQQHIVYALVNTYAFQALGCTRFVVAATACGLASCNSAADSTQLQRHKLLQHQREIHAHVQNSPPRHAAATQRLFVDCSHTCIVIAQVHPTSSGAVLSSRKRLTFHRISTESVSAVALQRNVEAMRGQMVGTALEDDVSEVGEQDAAAGVAAPVK